MMKKQFSLYLGDNGEFLIALSPDADFAKIGQIITILSSLLPQNEKIALLSASSVADDLPRSPTAQAGLPPELSTLEAHDLLRRLVAANLINSEWMPLVKTNVEKAVLAHDIGVCLNIRNYWKFFQNFWSLTRLCATYGKALSQKNMGSFMRKVLKVVFGDQKPDSD